MHDDASNWNVWPTYDLCSQASDSDNDASGSGACKARAAKPAPVRRATKGGGSDDESAAERKAGKVRFSVSASLNTPCCV